MKKRKLGNTDIHLSAIGFGGAPIGNLFEKLEEENCYKILENCYNSNINLYDTSPYYGYGLSEHRLGNFLKTVDADSYYLSTKVGRYLTPDKAENIDRGKWAGGLNFRPNVDYSYDGVMRSFDQSLHRLAASKIDICLIHDVDKYTYGDQVDHYFRIAMSGAYKAISKLKEEKVIKAIGIGVNNSDICKRFAEEGEFDCILLAGRYTLLDQSALNDCLPIAEKKNIGIILAGVFNSGILAKGIADNITYFYDEIPEDIKIKYNEISKICEKYKVSVATVALQFCYANKQISSMIIGMDSLEQIESNISKLNVKIPTDLWIELKNAKIIDERCVCP
jgi:D-threo-aldose 1-dehydrogenase